LSRRGEIIRKGITWETNKGEESLIAFTGEKGESPEKRKFYLPILRAYQRNDARGDGRK